MVKIKKKNFFFEFVIWHHDLGVSYYKSDIIFEFSVQKYPNKGLKYTYLRRYLNFEIRHLLANKRQEGGQISEKYYFSESVSYKL